MMKCFLCKKDFRYKDYTLASDRIAVVFSGDDCSVELHIVMERDKFVEFIAKSLEEKVWE